MHVVNVAAVIEIHDFKSHI